MDRLPTWCLLVLTLPTGNATARMRFWRALKAMGCAVLRDGVYLLPHHTRNEQALRELADAIVEAGGAAHLIRAMNLDAAQASCFRSLFDRSDDYAGLAKALNKARKSLSALSPVEINRLLRRLRREYEVIRAADHFPNDATAHAEVAWMNFVSVVDTVLSPGEPHAADGTISRLNRKDYQGRTWATRRHLWVDRVASAWLIRRFIDRKARFLWLKKPADCPRKALGFDFDGAVFTHVGERVTFEVLLASFGLEEDRALARLGEMVRSLDVGGPIVPEAGGFEAVLAGTRQRVADDDRLLEETGRVLDSLYAHFRTSPPEGTTP